MSVQTWRSYLPRGLSRRAALLGFLRVNWHLGFTAFGGPPAHFKIFHDKFVRQEKWIDEQFFQELFSVSQALSGPASTKMLYCINLIHNGTLAAVLGFIMWSLPAAIAMFGLSLGVANIDETLPGPAYALLSGINAAVVGVVALATIELSTKAITDGLTRFLVFFTASAGVLFNALWYFPVLMAVSGLATLVYDLRWLHRPVRALMRLVPFWRRRPSAPENGGAQQEAGVELGVVRNGQEGRETAAGRGGEDRTNGSTPQGENEAQPGRLRTSTAEVEPRVVPQALRIGISWRAGAAVIATFFVFFLTIMVLRGTLVAPPQLYRLFANMCLAGTIIFGGGPVVIPLLREYVVAEGWVSQRDFLIGLAIIQALPGPNFNFAVFLGSLTAVNAGYSAVAGAVIAWLGIFLPGMVLVHGTMGVWSALRSRRSVKAVLRGVNAGAVGLIYTAVYRIWQVGYVRETAQQGGSLGDDPWWLVVAAASFFFGRWWRVSPPIVIIAGAIMGLIWYGVVSR
ncbi:Chromate transporter [Niveomyces insectorum RCEF 264]|uniref:Chromate transporter n=1 Tax=Niveomyces insectorum RCEF 264 TaxID=1081102 RepID=A0A167QUL2_9HYPO|nr:Chromate transporter [Niveomyces insectorum RCEF 264]